MSSTSLEASRGPRPLAPSSAGLKIFERSRTLGPFAVRTDWVGHRAVTDDASCEQEKGGFSAWGADDSKRASLRQAKTSLRGFARSRGRMDAVLPPVGSFPRQVRLVACLRRGEGWGGRGHVCMGCRAFMRARCSGRTHAVVPGGLGVIRSHGREMSSVASWEDQGGSTRSPRVGPPMTPGGEGGGGDYGSVIESRGSSLARGVPAGRFRQGTRTRGTLPPYVWLSVSYATDPSLDHSQPELSSLSPWPATDKPGEDIGS